jgi:predicted nucleic acid-binding protein
LKVVIDASVTIKWVLSDKPDEQDVHLALQLLASVDDGVVEALQPAHWIAEVLAVVARFDRTRLRSTVQLLSAMPKHLVASDSIYERAGEMAADLDHHLFDTLYHAVALGSDATFVTADEKYYARARHLGGIQRLADLRVL